MLKLQGLSHARDVVTFVLLREKYIEELASGHQVSANQVLHDRITPLVKQHADELSAARSVAGSGGAASDLDIISSTPWDTSVSNDLGNPQNISSLANSTTPEADIPGSSRRNTPESDPSDDVSATGAPVTPTTEPSFVMRCLTFAFGRVWRKNNKGRKDSNQPSFDSKEGSYAMMGEQSRTHSVATFTRVTSDPVDASVPMFQLNVPLDNIWCKKSLEDLSMLGVCGMSSCSPKTVCCGNAPEKASQKPRKDNQVDWKSNIISTAHWLSLERGSRKILWEWIAQEALDKDIIPPGRLSELIGRALDTECMLAAKEGHHSKPLTLFRNVSTCSSDTTSTVEKPQSLVLRGHDGEVWAVSSSPDGSLLASGDDKGVIKIWNIKEILSGEEIQRGRLSDSSVPEITEINSHTEPVTCLSWSKCGNFLLSGSEDLSIRLWDIDKLRRTTNGAARDHDGEPSAEKVFGRHRNHITKVAWLSDDNHFVSCGEDGALIIWNSQCTSPVCQEWQELGITDFTTCCYDDTLSDPFSDVYQRRRPTDCIFMLRHRAEVRILFVDVNNMNKTGNGKCAVQFLRIDDFNSSNDLVKNVINASQEHALHAGQAVGSPPQSVSTALEKVAHKQPSKGRSNDGHMFGYYANEFCSISDKSVKPPERAALGKCSSIAVDRKGRSAVIAAQHLPLRLWDLYMGKPVGQFFGHRQHRYVLRPTFCGHRDELLAMGSEDCCVYLWNRKSSGYIHQLEGHSGVVNSLTWASNGKAGILVSGSDDTTVRLWHLPFF